MANIRKKKGFQTALVGLRDKILTGELVKGDHLAEVVLANELGISRTPLREAMRELTDQGLIEKLPNGRYQVCSLTRDDVRDFIALRGILEGSIFRLAAEKGISPQQRDACQETLTALDDVINVSTDAIDFDRYMALNEQLHVQFAAISDSPVMLNELARINKLPMASPSAFLGGQAASDSTLRSLFGAQDQHKSIFDAICNREGARAEALGREHARLAYKNLDLFLETGQPATAQIPGLALVEELGEPQTKERRASS
ncbi:MAG: GntR family transcriptional regulator [Yoonia sp.]|uniref:GntR family transcriptional regulator n=1 Tax=Yoonia sp. TaxID=2212373 RepID=UPI003EF33855